MNPQWRTSTVVALCRRMLDTRVFDTMPILADALQDVGCADDKLLAECQNPKLETVRAERLVNLIYSEETAAAVRWLEQFVRDINYGDSEDEDAVVGKENGYPHTYEFIIQVGHQGVENGHMYFSSDAGAGFFWEGEDNVREFFRNWSLVTGVAVPKKAQEKITFSCAC